MLYKIALTVVLLYFSRKALGDKQWKPWDGVCGNSHINPKIMNGIAAEKHEWPWMVRLLGSTDGYGMGCGGSLINDEWVLTAAHCAMNSSTRIKYKQITATFGDYDSQNNTDQQKFKLSIIKNIIHEDYDTKYLSNDIALLKLDVPLDLNGRHNYLEPICLSNTKEFEYYKCVATGWGVATFSDDPNILQKAELPIVDDKLCMEKWLDGYQSSKQLCAGIPNQRNSTCRGDSGGPLNCKLGLYGAWMVTGIASYGTTKPPAKCITPPSVFTRVSAYLPWIQKTITDNTIEKPKFNYVTSVKNNFVN